jgi:hypothetical protein
MYITANTKFVSKYSPMMTRVTCSGQVHQETEAWVAYMIWDLGGEEIFSIARAADVKIGDWPSSG